MCLVCGHCVWSYMPVSKAIKDFWDGQTWALQAVFFSLFFGWNFPTLHIFNITIFIEDCVFLSILLFSCHISYRSDCCPLFQASSILLIHWRRRGLMLRFSQFSLSFLWTHDLGCVKWTACAVCRLALSSPQERNLQRTRMCHCGSDILWPSAVTGWQFLWPACFSFLLAIICNHLELSHQVCQHRYYDREVFFISAAADCSSVWFITTFPHFRFLLLHFTALVRLHSLETHATAFPLSWEIHVNSRDMLLLLLLF